MMMVNRLHQMKSRRVKATKRVKKKEADLAIFKLIINNQGQFITEKSLYPRDKINLHFKKENSGIISAILRESEARFDMLTEVYETILKKLS
jgi:uncharacterized protein (DUF2252 family)